MSLPEQRGATYEDLLAVPDTKIAEIIHGELHVNPRPAGPHAVCSSFLGMDLGQPFQRGRGGPGGWWIVDEPELHLGEHILVPDLAGWRRERLPVYPADPFVTLPPDWVCEIVSDSSRGVDRVRKLPIYAEFEVHHAWIVDPEKETLEIFRLEKKHWVLIGTHEGEAAIRAEPFDAIALELGGLWDRGQKTPPPSE